MKITTNGPVDTLSGAHGHYVYITSETGEVFAANRRRRKKRTPSAEQRAIRTFMQYAAENWKNLSDAQREAWLVYAKTHFQTDATGRKVRASGLATYVRANSIRQVLGLPLTTAAPTVAPPPPLLEIQQLGAQNPDSIGFTVVHGITNLAGHSVLVRMTAAGLSQADAPNTGDYRFVRGAAPASAQPLTATGSDLTFSPTRFIVNDGERYGIEARVVRISDGMVSAPVYGDFRKSI